MSDRDQQHNSTNRQQGENIQSRQVVSPGGTVRVLSPGGTSRIMPPLQPDQSALIQQLQQQIRELEEKQLRLEHSYVGDRRRTSNNNNCAGYNNNYRGRNTTCQAFSGTQTPARQSEGRIRFNRPSYDLNTRRIRHESRIPSRSPTPPRERTTGRDQRDFLQERCDRRRNRPYDREELPNSRRRISFTPPREGERTQRSSRSFSITPSQRRHEEELLWQRREASGHRNTPSTDLASKSREPPVNPAPATTDIQQLLNTLKNQDITQDKRLQALTMGAGASPFSATVQSYYVGRHVKVPDFEKYDDTSDPFDHILTFKAKMVLCGDEDALYCKLFPTTLSGEALRWFHNLPPSSIHNFSQLASEFALHYRFNWKKERGTEILFNTKMRADETLYKYVRRFKKAVSELVGVPEILIIHAFKEGLRYDNNGMDRALTMKLPESIEALYALAEQYINIEDAARYQANKDQRNTTQLKGIDTSQISLEDQEPVQQAPNPVKKSHGGDISVSTSNNGKTYTQRNFHNNYTELNLPLDVLYDKIQDKNYLFAPRPLKEDTNNERDKSKWCKFHKDYGHNTADCHALKNGVQRLVNEGKLSEFVKEIPTVPRVQNCVATYTTTAERISMIHAAYSRVDSLNNTQRKIATRTKLRFIADFHDSFDIDFVKQTNLVTFEETPINFTDADSFGVFFPHYDALVINAKIGLWDIRRVMIDGGSDASVIYVQAYSSMGLPDGLIVRDSDPIYGFNGSSSRPEGRITLPVCVGPKVVDIDFMLMNCKSPYNAILGRDWVHAVDAIPSTKHQCVKFLVGDKVCKVRGDQISSHTCHEKLLNEYNKSEVKGTTIMEANIQQT